MPISTAIYCFCNSLFKRKVLPENEIYLVVLIFNLLSHLMVKSGVFTICNRTLTIVSKRRHFCTGAHGRHVLDFGNRPGPSWLLCLVQCPQIVLQIQMGIRTASCVFTGAQCVAVRIDAMTAQLETADCASTANKFICEVRIFLKNISLE